MSGRQRQSVDVFQWDGLAVGGRRRGELRSENMRYERLAGSLHARRSVFGVDSTEYALMEIQMCDIGVNVDGFVGHGHGYAATI